jgi:acyl carrier protein
MSAVSRMFHDKRADMDLSTADQVRGIIRRTYNWLDPDCALSADQNLDALGADSLDHIELLNAIEIRFHISEGLEAQAPKTVGDLIAIVERRVSANG